MRLLVRREHSQQELRRKLELRHFSSEQCRVVIEALTAEGLQSEERFAESYSRARINKGYGPVRIRYELRERGVESFDLDSIIEEMGDEWSGLIRKVYVSKYGEQFDGDFKEFAKQNRFLQHRGFTADQIKNLFSILKTENQKRRSL